MNNHIGLIEIKPDVKKLRKMKKLTLVAALFVGCSLYSQTDSSFILISGGFGVNQFYSVKEDYPVSSGISNSIHLSFHFKLSDKIYLRTGYHYNSAYSNILISNNTMQIKEYYAVMPIGIEGVSPGRNMKYFIGAGIYDSYNYRQYFKSYDNTPAPGTVNAKVLKGGIYVNTGIHYQIRQNFALRLTYYGLRDLWFWGKDILYKPQYFHNIIALEVVDLF